MNGILCIDKPAGMTSFDVVAKLRRFTGERKVGHAGTLDPMATGVLPVFFGEATKAISLLENHNKRYTAGLRLGITTDTGDITGKTLSQQSVNVTDQEVMDAAEMFRGIIEQVPPMYSAIKLNGRRLYDIAREGGEVERAARKIQIFEIGIEGRDTLSGDYILSVSCSKGTYIRTLCEDIGRKLGCGATMSALRRTYAAGFSIEDCSTLEQAETLSQTDNIWDIILSVEHAFRNLPEISITDKQKERFRNGGELSFERVKNHPESGLCRVKCGDLFIGIGEADAKSESIKVKCHYNREVT